MIRVLTSPPPSQPHANPYIRLLNNELGDKVALVDFSFRAAILGKFEVVHIHWPEYLLRSPRRRGRALRAALFTLFLATLRLKRPPVVATRHNDSPHETGGALERLLLRRWDVVTTDRIYLTAASANRDKSNVRRSVIPHGHYGSDLLVRGVAAPRTSSSEQLLLTFGSLKRYKGIDDLLRSVAEARRNDLNAHVRIVGEPDRPATREEILTALAGDDRLSADLSFVPDYQLYDEILKADGVILPYPSMNNSGALMLAVTLSRPVLVSDTPATRELRTEIGPYWIQTFNAPLNAEDVRRFATHVRTASESSANLVARDWKLIGGKHIELYREALRARRQMERRGSQ